MTLFHRITLEEKSAAPAKRRSAFRVVADDDRAERLSIVLELEGSNEAPRMIWSREFDSRAELESVIGNATEAGIEAGFWGRLVLLLGPSALDTHVDGLSEMHRERIAGEEKERRRQAAARQRVQCFAPDKKGQYYLTLERDSDDKPEWSIAFRGKAERERLRDWFRWQSCHFLEFLDYAAEHGAPALEKRLIREMYETEQRVKKEGRSAGGVRPLRMWRGE